jgi:hypothetical protein
MSDSWRDRLRPVGDVQPERDLLPGIFERAGAPAVGRDRGRRLRRPAGFVLAGIGCVLVLGVLAFAAHSRGAPDASQPPSSSRTALFTTHRANGYRLEFRYPASWHAYNWMVVSSFTFSMAYLSTGVEHDPCVSTANTTTCGSPITKVEPNGVFVSWTAESGMMSDFALVPGHSHRLPSGWFVKLSIHTNGSEGSSDARRTIVAVTAPSRHSKNLWTLIARLRGPKLASNTQAVLALLDSTKQIRDPADESPSTTFTITYRHDQLQQTGPMVRVSDPPLHLSCNPAVGDVTNPAEACRLIQAHPARYIGRAGHVCRGPVTRWDVKIHGLFRGRPVSRDYDMCDYPQARAWTDLGGTTFIGVVPAGSPEAIAGPKNR